MGEIHPKQQKLLGKSTEETAGGISKMKKIAERARKGRVICYLVSRTKSSRTEAWDDGYLYLYIAAPVAIALVFLE